MTNDWWMTDPRVFYQDSELRREIWSRLTPAVQAVDPADAQAIEKAARDKFVNPDANWWWEKLKTPSITISYRYSDEPLKILPTIISEEVEITVFIADARPPLPAIRGNINPLLDFIGDL
jgi:hypothetical protein